MSVVPAGQLSLAGGVVLPAEPPEADDVPVAEADDDVPLAEAAVVVGAVDVFEVVAEVTEVTPMPVRPASSSSLSTASMIPEPFPVIASAMPSAASSVDVMDTS